MAAGDTYQLTLKGLCQGQAIVNSHHLRAMAAGDLSQAFADTFNTSLLTTYRAVHSTDWALQTISCRQINPPGPVAYERAPTTSAGTLSTTSGALTSAACVKQTSAFIGRSRRARSFIGPVPPGDILLGSLSVGFTTALNNYFTALMGLWGPTGSDAANGRLVVWSTTIAKLHSQATPPAMGDPLSASAYVVAYHVDPVARVIRRRELGVGA